MPKASGIIKQLGKVTSGVNAKTNKPWNKYSFLLDDNEWYSTFNDDFGKTLSAGRQLEFDYEDKPWTDKEGNQRVSHNVVLPNKLDLILRKIDELTNLIKKRTEHQEIIREIPVGDPPAKTVPPARMPEEYDQENDEIMPDDIPF